MSYAQTTQSTSAPQQQPREPIRPLPAQTAAAIVAEVLVPLIARGLIIRRRRVVGVLARLDADRRATSLLRRVRAAHGPGPVLLKLPRRRLALVLTSADARSVLDATPDPFTPATLEKRAALSRFEPHGVLISPAQLRPPRRAFNEQALETGHPVHSFGAALAARIDSEVDGMVRRADAGGELSWSEFQRTFNRVVRGVVLGDAAAGDEELSEQLDALRGDANWGYLLPRRRLLRERFRRRLSNYLEHPDPGALSGHIAHGQDGSSVVQQAVEQVPQWLFAFDAAGIASFATLALLATHDAERRTARAEVAEAARETTEAPTELPFMRACVLETLRLWPTTPAILRDTTSETAWPSGQLPRLSGVLIFAPLLHREPELQPDPDSFSPARWLDGGGVQEAPDMALMPFSGGPGRCPGRELVLLVTSQLLAGVLARSEPELTGRLAGRLQPGRPLPGTLDHFQLQLRLRPTGS